MAKGDFSKYIDIHALNRLCESGVTKRVVLNVYDNKQDGVRYLEISTPGRNDTLLRLPLARLLTLSGTIALEQGE